MCRGFATLCTHIQHHILSHILFNPLPHRRHDSPGPRCRIHHSVFWFHCDRELVTQRPPTVCSTYHFDLSTTLTELRLTARHSHSLCCVFRPSPSTFPRDFEKPLDIQVPTPFDLPLSRIVSGAHPFLQVAGRGSQCNLTCGLKVAGLRPQCNGSMIHSKSLASGPQCSSLSFSTLITALANDT